MSRAPSRFLSVEKLCLLGAGLSVLVLGLSACDGGKSEREWTVADHGGSASAGAVQPDSSRALPTTPGADQKSAQARAATILWSVRCASCHGEKGLGNGAAKPPGVQIPSFASASFQQSRSDAQLTASIVNGKGLMPAFGKQLKPDGIAALVQHIRTLGPQE